MMHYSDCNAAEVEHHSDCNAAESINIIYEPVLDPKTSQHHTFERSFWLRKQPTRQDLTPLNPDRAPGASSEARTGSQKPRQAKACSQTLNRIYSSDRLSGKRVKVKNEKMLVQLRCTAAV
eukprot:6206453-Pleurochrysis_carterae.AAC.1